MSEVTVIPYDWRNGKVLFDGKFYYLQIKDSELKPRTRKIRQQVRYVVDCPVKGEVAQETCERCAYCNGVSILHSYAEVMCLIDKEKPDEAIA